MPTAAGDIRAASDPAPHQPEDDEKQDDDGDDDDQEKQALEIQRDRRAQRGQEGAAREGKPE